MWDRVLIEIIETDKVGRVIDRSKARGKSNDERHFYCELTTVRLTFEQIQLTRHVWQYRVLRVEPKQLMQWSCLEHGQT